MTLVVDLPSELESELTAEAAALGLTLPEYVLRVLSAARPSRPAPRTGAELVDYWEAEGVIGSRPDIEDASAHARELREQAQRRTRP